MKTFYSLPEKVQEPVSLTIGNFDGVHLGHQKVLDTLLSSAQQSHHPSCVLTFSNHPASVLNPSQNPLLICTQRHKQVILEKKKIDILFMIPFTKELSSQSPEEFIKNLFLVLPFSSLTLGSDATIGKDRQGTQDVMHQLGHQFSFSLTYVPDELYENQRISSRRIRNSILQGDLQDASKLLGRPYSIIGNVIQGKGRGAEIGFHTANIGVEGLCLPPLGVYSVDILHKGKRYPGIANLGKAPTVRTESHPILEVHLFDVNIPLYGEALEVEFKHFIRPERRFNTIAELKEQIALDIKSLL